MRINSTVSGDPSNEDGSIYGEVTATSSTISGDTGSGVSGLYRDIVVVCSTVSIHTGFEIVDSSPEGGARITMNRRTVSSGSRLAWAERALPCTSPTAPSLATSRALPEVRMKG